jgi:glucoamylase
LGEVDRALRYRQAAETLKAAMVTHLFSRRHGRFVQRLMDDPENGEDYDPTLDASLFGLFAFGAFEATDPRVVATMEGVRARLWVQTEVGGLARYENDWYWQVSQNIARVLGNPWIFARSGLRNGRSGEPLQRGSWHGRSICCRGRRPMPA